MATRIEPAGKPKGGQIEGLAVGSGRSWLQKYRLPYLYIAPAAIILAIVTFYPIFYSVYLSFTNFGLKNLRGTPPDWVWFRNYERIIRGELPITGFDFWRILGFNFTWTIVNVFFHVVIGVAVALLLNKHRIIGRRVFRAIFIIPWAMPPLVVATVWRNMFDEQFGAINLSLKALHLPHQINWLGSTDPPIPGVEFLPLSFFAVVIANVWLGWPFMMVVATGALQSIPRDLYEAAKVDGASRAQQFWDITAPLLRPAMVPAIMYGTILTFNQFNVIYFISQGGPLGRSEILVTQAFKLVNPSGFYGIASAFSVMIFFILLIITLAQNRVARGLEGWSDA
jgi:arabinogalactan oligomer/maltooligosaccharide transport system permease protein